MESRIFQWVRDNSLSVTFFCLFAATLAGQSVSGFRGYNRELISNHHATVTFLQYLGTGNFLNGIFVNWQAAILQLGCLIVFGEELYQKGAPHSRKTQKGPEGKEMSKGHASWLYSNSLSLAFGVMFFGFFLIHLFTGVWAYNERRSLSAKAPVSAATFFFSGTFWFKTLQTWEAEFFAIGIYIVLSIFLRQKGSAESKPVESSDEDTGDTNE